MSGSPEMLGDAPIEPQYLDLMNELGRAIDDILNVGQSKKERGFVLMVFELENHEGRCNYASNATRDSVKLIMKEQLARFEGRIGRDGTA